MHKYLPQFYHFIDNLNIKNIQSLDSKFALIYRNYKKEPSKKEILEFKSYCKLNKKIFLLSNYHKLVLKYNLDGLYIPSFNKKKLYLNIKKKKFIILGSAHNLKEIRIKEMQNVQLIMLSPVFKSKGPNNYMGLYRFNILKKLAKIPVIPLGGINTKTLKLLNMFDNKGFAAINFLKSMKKHDR